MVCVSVRGLLVLLSLGLLAGACSSTDGSVHDDFDDSYLNSGMWEQFSYSSTGAVDEVDGALHVHGLSGGWDGVGVRFVQEVDLTAGSLYVEFRAKAGNSEVLLSMAHRATRGDPYLERPMSEWYVGDGIWKYNSPDDGHEITPKYSIETDMQRYHTYTLNLTPIAGNDELWDYRTTVDDGALGDARGKWTPKGGDATVVHLYFHACQEEPGGVNTGSFFDDIVIESPSIIGQSGGCQVGL